jgi:AcrR family transcriptional regulator
VSSRESVWLRGEPPHRDRRLTREQIVDVTVEILDAEGRDGLSMRRVASGLGVSPGALYWYVTTKDHLVELALDAVLGEVLDGLQDTPGVPDWRSGLSRLAHGNREMYLRHPWVPADLATQPNLGPNALALADTGLTILADAGFAEEDLDAALAAVNDHVTGAVVAETAWRSVAERRAADGDDWTERAGDYLKEIGERHPRLAERLATSSKIDIDGECERRFEFGLGCLLDGLAARLP